MTTWRSCRASVSSGRDRPTTVYHYPVWDICGVSYAETTCRSSHPSGTSTECGWPWRSFTFAVLGPAPVIKSKRARLAMRTRRTGGLQVQSLLLQGRISPPSLVSMTTTRQRQYAGRCPPSDRWHGAAQEIGHVLVGVFLFPVVVFARDFLQYHQYRERVLCLGLGRADPPERST